MAGVAGDEIKVRNKQLFLNGQSVSEPYVVHTDNRTYPGKVPVMTQNYQSAWESGSFARSEGQQVRDNFGPIRVPTGSFFILGDSQDTSFDSRFCGPLLEKLVTGKAIRIYSPPEHAKQLQNITNLHKSLPTSRLTSSVTGGGRDPFPFPRFQTATNRPERICLTALPADGTKEKETRAFQGVQVLFR